MATQQAGDQPKSELDQLPSQEEMGKMDFDALFQLRAKYKSQEAQDAIAPFEHRAFARDVVKNNPLHAVGMAVATPVYTAGKATGMIEARSKGSVEEVKQAFIGIGEGISGAIAPWKRKWNDITEGVKEAPNKPVAGPKPWERAWGTDKTQEPVKEPSDRFEKVFNNLIQAESRGVHSTGGKLTESGAGARGITQLMRKTAADPGYGVTPVQNESKEEYIRFGKDYLRALLKEFNGDYEKALAAYNAGPGNVKKAIEKGAGNWKAHLPKPEETLPYIKKIMGNVQGKSEPVSRETVSQDKVLGLDPDDPGAREIYEKLPTIQGKELLKSSLSTLSGRNQWSEKIEKEMMDERKGKTRAQLDKLPSNSFFYARKHYPQELSQYIFFHNNNIDGIPDNAMSYLDTHDPKIAFTGKSSSTTGFVFANKGDRVFMQGGDLNTMIHETEHLRQQRDIEQMGSKAPHNQVGMLGNSNAPVQKMMNLMSKERDNPAFKEVFRASNAFEGSNEYLANFVGYMKTGIPKGKSWSDTPFYKELVKKVGEKEALNMLLDTIFTANRVEYTIDRVNK